MLRKECKERKVKVMEENNNSFPETQLPPFGPENVMIKEIQTKYDEMKAAFVPYGIGCLLYGLLFTVSLYKGFHGISMPVLMAATIVGLYLAMKKLETVFKKSDLFYIIGIQLLGISCCLTGDMVLIFFNVCGMFLLIISWMLSRFCNTSTWGFPKYLKEILKSIFIPIGYIDGFFKSLGQYFEKKEEKTNSKAKYIWIGVLLGVPFVVIVTSLLVSADAVFGNLFQDLFKNIHLPENPVWMFFLLVIGILGSFGMLGYFANEKIKCDENEKRTWEPVVAITFLSFSTVVYLVFSVVQIMYLFIGGFALPEDYTYATYAHEGFYQLLAVCFINLIVLFICIGKFRENIVLKIILTVFSICTYIMLCSSAFRMILYVGVYQLTYLRLMTLWGLFVIGLVLIGCFITIWKNAFPLFQYATIIVAVLYITLSFARPGYVIAKYNLTGQNDNVDTRYLLDLNSDAVSVYLESPQFAKEIAEEKTAYEIYQDTNGDMYGSYKRTENGELIFIPELYGKLKEYQNLAEDTGITDFNFSYYRVGKQIEKKVGKII